MGIDREKNAAKKGSKQERKKEKKDQPAPAASFPPDSGPETSEPRGALRLILLLLFLRGTDPAACRGGLETNGD